MLSVECRRLILSICFLLLLAQSILVNLLAVLEIICHLEKKLTRKQVVLKIYHFSVTEDFLLLNSIQNLKKYKVIHPLNRDSLVISKPASRISELFNQKKRWAVGGIDTPPIGIGLMLWSFLDEFFLLFTPFFFSATWLYLAIIQNCN